MLLLCTTLAVIGRVPKPCRCRPTADRTFGYADYAGRGGLFFILNELAGQWLAIVAALLLGTLLSVFTTLWLLTRLMDAAMLTNLLPTLTATPLLAVD